MALNPAPRGESCALHSMAQVVESGEVREGPGNNEPVGLRS